MGPGNHLYADAGFLPLNSLTADRFRLRFTFSGDTEVFGFRFADPLCNPNPCLEPGRTICDSSTGKIECLCNPPLHDDGNGECTADPCLPDPCTGPHQQNCTADGDQAVCGCEDGWAAVGGECIPDPCLGVGGEPPCLPPEPDRCRVLEDGSTECYCPEGSEPGATGCYEIHPRAFVTSVGMTGAEIGGLESADALCNTLAVGADMGGNYVAWLSAPGSGAGSRLGDGGPWRTWDPEVTLWTALVANNLGDLVDGSLHHPIQYTEFGAPLDGPPQVWTGTQADGSPMSESELFGGTCGGWTDDSAGQFAITGLSSSTNEAWTAWSPAQCGQSYRLYCFQKGGNGDGGVGEAPVEDK